MALDPTQKWHLRSHRGRELVVTPTDVLWLKRAVEAEGPPRPLVAQTLVNRWAWALDRGVDRYPRLQDMVRAYAQPVNPRWYEDGDLHKMALEAARADGDLQRATVLATRARRRELVNSTRNAFSPDTEAAVLLALQGPLTLPPGVTQFAATNRKGLPVVIAPRPRSGPNVPGANGFFLEQDGRSDGYLYHPHSEPGPRPLVARVLDFGKPSATLPFVLLAGVALFGLLRRHS